MASPTTSLNPTQIIATAVIIKASGTEIGVESTYDSPSHECFFKEEYDKLFSFSNTVLIAGDFNSKHTVWGSKLNNKRGKKLLSYTLRKNLSIHAPNDITYIPINKRHKENILDFAISKNLSSSINVFTVRELPSDHFPVAIH